MLLAVAACDKTVSSVEGTRAIGFDGAFVNNSVKATDASKVTAAKIKSMWVYGFAETVKIFDGKEIAAPENYSTTALWTYKPTQYWSPKHAYGFTALTAVKEANGAFTATMPSFTAPSDNTQGGSIEFENDGETDLLYDYQARTTDDPLTAATTTPVPFTFKHLLARVKFTAKNTTGVNDGISLTVTDIQLKNVAKKATLDCSAANCAAGAQAPWTATTSTDDLTLMFGNAGDAAIASGSSAASAQWHYIIPTNDAFDAYFTVKINNNGIENTKKFKVEIDAFNWEVGYSYNFVAELNNSVLGESFPIQFTVAGVQEWRDWNVNLSGTDDTTWFTAPAEKISTVTSY